MNAMTAAQVTEFLETTFSRKYAVCTHADAEKVVLVQETGERHLRPGGTVSGPVLMALADAAMYAAILARMGAVVMAVTSNLSINFLRRPAPGQLKAEARILKLGRRLAFGEVYLFCNEETEPVAHATLTYSIPPQGDKSE
jgi:uncharacterized protein (TIGR00369 family)